MPGASRRQTHRRWLMELAAIPTAAGREERVVEWITRWARRRRNLKLRRDTAGNLVITRPAPGSRRPIFLTAHLDHPAFVVREVLDDRSIELEFRGGVKDPYFDGARIEIFDARDTAHGASVLGLDEDAKPFKRVVAGLDRPTSALSAGDVGRWAFAGRALPRVVDGLLHAPACDDLAGVAAALATLDSLSGRWPATPVGALLTRAEEVGFVGAAAACKERSIPKRARLICLECSRSFPDSPIGEGPILRVGDRLSVFSAELTNRLSLLLSDYLDRHPGFKAQRKLMPGGVCEATTFSAYGYESTCVCLPLGNYHNMEDIAGVEGGKRPARIGPEYISIDDYYGMIELLVFFTTRLDTERLPPIVERMNKNLRAHGRLLK